MANTAFEQLRDETGESWNTAKRVLLESFKLQANTDKAKDVLGFEAEVSLEESVREVIEYMKEKHHEA